MSRPLITGLVSDSLSLCVYLCILFFKASNCEQYETKFRFSIYLCSTWGNFILEWLYRVFWTVYHLSLDWSACSWLYLQPKDCTKFQSIKTYLVSKINLIQLWFNPYYYYIRFIHIMQRIKFLTEHHLTVRHVANSVCKSTITNLIHFQKLFCSAISLLARMNSIFMFENSEITL